jgi:hypothetical protein
MNEANDEKIKDPNENFILNVKKSNTFVSCFNMNHTYSNLICGDKENKICFSFSPRAGCSISFKCYLDFVHLLEDGNKHSPNWIHTYRSGIFNCYTNYMFINQLIEEKYTFIKFIMNPYIRAVSIFRAQSSHNLSFREYLKQLVDDKIDYFNDNDKYHLQKQYIEGEELIITKYIRINENETYNIKLKDGRDYIIDPNKYSAPHHSVKTNNTEFCGDIPKDTINQNLPKSYKYFYDEEIKSLVDTFYKDDVEKYNFSFDNF